MPFTYDIAYCLLHSNSHTKYTRSHIKSIEKKINSLINFLRNYCCIFAFVIFCNHLITINSFDKSSNVGLLRSFTQVSYKSYDPVLYNFLILLTPSEPHLPMKMQHVHHLLASLFHYTYV